MLWISQHQRSRNVCLCAAWPLSQQHVENNWNDCKENRHCTHSNKCMTMHAHQKPSDVYLPASHCGHCHWLQGEPPTCTRGNLLMWSSWDFSLSPQYQVTLFFYFFLIKSQQQCYLTLIWSQLNPCLNLGRCGAHSNFLSIQPLTSLGLLSWLWVCWSESLDTFDCVIRGISCRSIKDSSKLRIQSHRPFCRCAPAEI